MKPTLTAAALAAAPTAGLLFDAGADAAAGTGHKGAGRAVGQT